MQQHKATPDVTVAVAAASAAPAAHAIVFSAAHGGPCWRCAAALSVCTALVAAAVLLVATPAGAGTAHGASACANDSGSAQRTVHQQGCHSADKAKEAVARE